MRMVQLVLLQAIILEAAAALAVASSFIMPKAARVRVSHRNPIILVRAPPIIIRHHQSLRNPVRTKFCSTAVVVVEVEEVVVLLLLAVVVAFLAAAASKKIDLLLISCMFP